MSTTPVIIHGFIVTEMLALFRAATIEYGHVPPFDVVADAVEACSDDYGVTDGDLDATVAAVRSALACLVDNDGPGW